MQCSTHLRPNDTLLLCVSRDTRDTRKLLGKSVLDRNVDLSVESIDQALYGDCSDFRHPLPPHATEGVLFTRVSEGRGGGFGGGLLSLISDPGAVS